MTRSTILIDARLPWGSGIGRYVRNIVPCVAARLTDVNFTLLVSPDDVGRADAISGTADNVTTRMSSIRPFSLSEQTRLPTLAAQYDLTWFTNYWVPLRWQGRFVATVHDLIHLDPRFPASTAKRFAAVRTFAKVRRHAAHIIFVSRYSARLFDAQIGTPREASIIHHGIDHAGITRFPIAERERGKVALVVAAAKEHKNLPLLIEAWREADPKDWRLVIVTPGDDLRSSIALTEQAGRSAGVEIRRGISDAVLSELYAEAGFVLVPSRYEGFGLPLLEAMQAGAPVVSSTADALVEVASGAAVPFVGADDRAGWVEIIRIMAHQCGPSNEWQRTLCAHNRDVAHTFTWARAGDATAHVLRDTLSG